jgi:endonuclease G, mitochondrial
VRWQYGQAVAETSHERHRVTTAGAWRAGSAHTAGLMAKLFPGRVISTEMPAERVVRQRAMPPAATTARSFGGLGYDRRFIGVSLPLPVARTQAVRNDLVGANGERLAHYTHFSLSIRRSRRMAAFVAWNIEGRITKPASKDATWQTDPRVPLEYQIDNSLYEGTAFDRGHIAKREDLLWGGESVAKQANDDSFCYTNATPQHEKFNRLAPALWKSLEDELFRQVDVADLRIALLGGPIFSPEDRPFVPPGAPSVFRPVLIPRHFFKVVAYRDNDDGRVKAMGFRLSQEPLVGRRTETARLDLSKFHMYQVDIAAIEALTGLSMAAFRRLDTKVAHDRLAPARSRQSDRPVRSIADVLR